MRFIQITDLSNPDPGGHHSYSSIDDRPVASIWNRSYPRFLAYVRNQSHEVSMRASAMDFFRRI